MQTAFPVYRPKACNSFSIRSDKPPHFCFNRDLRFVTVELSKFQAKGNVHTLVDFQDIWCYILKESRKVGQQEFKELSGRGPEMEEAMTYLRKFSEEEQRQILREAREKNRRDQVAREDYVFDQGKEEGMQKGMQKVALNILKSNFKPSVISNITGLSKNEIKKLMYLK